MIPTTEQASDMDQPIAPKSRKTLCTAILALVIIVLVQACTNSKLIIGPLYNRLDDGMRKEFNKLGDFTDEQNAAFETSLGNYHVWHRRSELPEYASLLSLVAGSVARADTTQTDVHSWFVTAEEHSLLVRQCHPVNFLFDFMRSLSDEELDYIQRRFKRQQMKNRKERLEKTPEEHIESRLKNIVKWSGRIGVDFTPTQRAMVLSSLKSQTSMSERYYDQSGKWNKQFFELTRDQKNPEYDAKMRAHLDGLWHLMENAYPEDWQANRDLWEQTAFRFISSLTREQRKAASQWLGKMSQTLTKISNDKPSFKYVDDASIGCLIGPES